MHFCRPGNFLLKFPRPRAALLRETAKMSRVGYFYGSLDPKVAADGQITRYRAQNNARSHDDEEKEAG